MFGARFEQRNPGQEDVVLTTTQRIHFLFPVWNSLWYLYDISETSDMLFTTYFQMWSLSNPGQTMRVPMPFAKLLWCFLISESSLSNNYCLQPVRDMAALYTFRRLLSSHGLCYYFACGRKVTECAVASLFYLKVSLISHDTRHFYKRGAEDRVL